MSPLLELAAYCLVRVEILEKEVYKGVTQAFMFDVFVFFFLIFAFIGDPGFPSYH